MSDDSLFDSDDPLRDMDPDHVERSARQLTRNALSRKTAWVLSLAGALPLLTLSLALLWLDSVNPLEAIAVDAMKTYGAVILSFLGGIRWGMALRNATSDDTHMRLIVSVVPSLAGWFSLLLPIPYVFAVQALAFAAQGAWDSFAGQKGEVQLWFVKLRMTLTFIVASCMIMGFFGTV